MYSKCNTLPNTDLHYFDPELTYFVSSTIVRIDSKSCFSWIWHSTYIASKVKLPNAYLCSFLRRARPSGIHAYSEDAKQVCIQGLCKKYLLRPKTLNLYDCLRLPGSLLLRLRSPPLGKEAAQVPRMMNVMPANWTLRSCFSLLARTKPAMQGTVEAT